MKKILAIVLSAGLALASLTACSSGEPEASNAEQTQQAEENKETEEAKTTEEKPAEGGEAAASGEKIKIGVAICNYKDTFQVYMRDAMIEQTANYPNYEFIFADGNEDVGKQIAQVEDFITAGCKGVIIVPVNVDTAGPMVSACKDAGVPVVTVNRLMQDQENVGPYVGSESIQAGIMQAEAVFEKLGGKGNVVVLTGPAGSENTVMRTQGVHQVAEEKYPDIKFVGEEIGNWNRDEGIRIVETWIQSGVTFDAVLANNDEMAMGATISLEAAGIRDKVIVAGIDATPDALEFMKEGRLDVTVFQDAKGQGRGGIDAIVKAVEGTAQENMIWIPFELVTPDKADEYMSKVK